jgi:tellurite resistance protein
MKANAVIQRAAESLRTRFASNEYSFAPIVDLATLVANADGTIDDAEMDALGECMRAVFAEHFGPEAVRYMVKSSVDLIKSVGVEARAKLIADVLASCDAAEDGLTLALAVAHASEGFSPEERAVVEMVATASGVTPARLEALIANVGSASGE